MYRLTVGAFVSALILITPDMAVALEEQQKAEVQVGDLDTATEQGADRALYRIRRAAQDVCDAPAGMRSRDDRVAGRACIQEVMSRAVADLGDPMVAAKFNGSRLYAER